MTRIFLAMVPVLLCAQSHFTQPDPVAFDDHAGWTRIFDGSTLKNWDGNPDVWHVENGAIVGESTPQHPSGTTNILWTGGQPKNFELKAEIKLEGANANSGIQYRSAAQAKHWDVKGYQADFDYANRYSGQLYEQDSPRGIIAWRGQMVRAEKGQHPRLLATLGDSDELKNFIRVGDWNQMHIIARGHEMIHIINGRVMAIFIDDDPSMAAAQGIIAIEIEGGGQVKVSVRDLWLKTLD